MAWSASTDNIGVIGYRIYRDSVEITTSADTFFTDSGLTPETSYTYSVSAYDIDELPFIDARTSAESVYYRLDLGGATDIRVMMAEPSDDDYQVVVDSESPDDQMFEGNLEASSHFIEIRSVNAGEYWLVIQYI